MKTQKLKDYEKSIHRMFETKKVSSPNGKVFTVYKKDIRTFDGLKFTRSGQAFIINNNYGLSRKSKKAVINLIKNN